MAFLEKLEAITTGVEGAMKKKYAKKPATDDTEEEATAGKRISKGFNKALGMGEEQK